MKNIFKKTFKIKENIKNNVWTKYPNLNTLYFQNIFNLDISLSKDNNINKLIFFEQEIIHNIDNYLIENIIIKDDILIIKYKSEYDLITKTYKINFNSKSLIYINENIEYIKIRDEWINNNIITIPKCNNINDIDLSTNSNNNSMILDLRNVNNVDGLLLSGFNHINTIIINFDQNIKIYSGNKKNNNLKIVIKDNKINTLENKLLELNFNEENKKKFSSIQNYNDKILIEYKKTKNTILGGEHETIGYIVVDDNLTYIDSDTKYDKEYLYHYHGMDNIMELIKFGYIKSSHDKYREYSVINKPFKIIMHEAEINKGIYKEYLKYKQQEFWDNYIKGKCACKKFPEIIEQKFTKVMNNNKYNIDEINIKKKILKYK